jgi:aspartyl-tRNA(Asn)/glutamyl-tRNA(Gln) amidotransferase subunit A
MIERVKKLLEKIKKEDKKINAFIELNPNVIKEAEEIEKKIKSGKAGKLAGKIIAIKSNINVKGLRVTCASKTLENYKSTFDATVIQKIRKEDGLIIGMTNMDEFACGSSGETSAFNPTKNPQNTELVPGGSSSGSAASVSADFCDMSLGSDTGGSIRNPASHCSVVGMKPSYGSVSRYGLIDLSMSLDQIGPFAKNVDDAELLYNAIKGKDDFDATTFDLEEKPVKKQFTIALSKDFEKLCSDKRIYDLIKKKTEELCKKKGWKLVNAELKHIDLAVSAYYPICYVEFFSATRRFDGRRYGFKIEEVCGPEVLRRILGGSEISKAEFRGTYYRKALKVKQIIKKEFDDAFKKVDAIISPTVPKLPHKIGSKISPEEMYAYDAFTIPANLAEICAISVPAGTISNIPTGIQIMCNQFEEKKLFEIAKEMEKK